MLPGVAVVFAGVIGEDSVCARWRVAVCACLKEVFVCDCGLQSGYGVSVNGRWQL